MTDSADNSVKKLLRSVLLTYKNGVPLHSIQKIYTEVTGESLLDLKSGFDLERFLRRIPDVVRVLKNSDGKLMCYGVADDSTIHIAKLVGKQKQPKKQRRDNMRTRNRGESRNNSTSNWVQSKSNTPRRDASFCYSYRATVEPRTSRNIKTQRNIKDPPNKCTAPIWSRALQPKSQTNPRIDSMSSGHYSIKTTNTFQENSRTVRPLNSYTSSNILREQNACVNQEFSDNFKSVCRSDSSNKRNISNQSINVDSSANELSAKEMTKSPLWRLLNLDTNVQASVPDSKLGNHLNINMRNTLDEYRNSCVSADLRSTPHPQQEHSSATKFVRTISSPNASRIRDGTSAKQNNFCGNVMQTSRKREAEHPQQSIFITVNNEHSNSKIPKRFHDTHVVQTGVQSNLYQKSADHHIEDLCITIKKVCIVNESWRKTSDADRSVSVIRT